MVWEIIANEDPDDFGISDGTSSPSKEQDVPSSEQKWGESSGTRPPTKEPE